MPRTQRKKIAPAVTSQLLFSKVLADSVDELRDRIELGKASMMLVDGQIGLGKTTVAVEAAEYYQGSPIDLDIQIAMGFNQFAKKLDICVEKGYKVIIYDEAGDFDKRGAMSKINRMLNRIFDTYRTYKILVIMILPNFSVLESQLFLKAIPRFLVHIEDRDEKKAEFKMFGLMQMMYLKDYMSRLIVPFDAYKRVFTPYTGVFYNLPAARAAQLDKLSTEGKRQVLRDYVEEGEAAEEAERKGIQLQADRDMIRERTRAYAQQVAERTANAAMLKDLEQQRIRAAAAGLRR